MIKAIIFDIDGTLIHTRLAYLEQLIRRCCIETGIEPTKENIERIWYGPIDEKIELMKSMNVDPAEFWKKLIEYDTIEERAKNMVPYDDVWVLKELAEKGIKLGIVTNAIFHMAKHEVNVLREHGIQFDAIITAFDKDLNTRIKPKPNPEGILECLEMLGVKKNEVIFVGDGPDDAEAAKTAGVLYVKIDREEHLIPIEATIEIKSLEELLKLIE